jgi:SAM-dependent methyltransferase
MRTHPKTPSAKPPRAQTLRTIRRRRAELRTAFDIAHSFETIEESCVPSYCHPNPLAAGISWWRLLAALSLARGRQGPVLDFGAASGEIYHLRAESGAYHFVEGNEVLAEALLRDAPQAHRERLDALPRGRFETVFALDSLEHNPDVPRLLDALVAALAPGGRLIVSGPTESAFYRLGRRLTGFSGHYHHATIYDIERELASRLERRALKNLPPLLPLFRVSAWEAASPPEDVGPEDAGPKGAGTGSARSRP